MRLRTLSAIVLTLGLGVNLGCTEESGLSESRSGLKPLVEATCDYEFRCCDAGERKVHMGPFTGSKSECTNRTLEVLTYGTGSGGPLEIGAGPILDRLLYIGFSIQEDRVEISSSAVNACVKWLDARTCPEWDAVMGGPAECGAVADNPCDPELIFKGLQGAGEACNTIGDVECKGDLTCVGEGLEGFCVAKGDKGDLCYLDADCKSEFLCDYMSGKCVDGLGEGATCAFYDNNDPQPGMETLRCRKDLACSPETFKCVADCNLGAVCNSDAECPDMAVCAVGICRLPGNEGAICDEHADCVATCDFNTPGPNGLCTAPLNIGDQCNQDRECITKFCSGATNLCEGTVPAGGPCPTGQDEQCVNSYCDGTQTCVAYVPEGGACTNNVQCDDPNNTKQLACVDMVCVATPLPNGFSCGSNQQCESRACYMGKCQDGSPVGQICDDNDPMYVPCVLGSYCAYTQDMNGNDIVPGTCTAKLPAGSECVDDIQCWGSCDWKWGLMICDDTPATVLKQLTCDGQ